MTDYEGVDMQDGSRRRVRGNRLPRCSVEGCRNPRATGTDERVKTLPLCWPHITVAHDVEDEARRTTRLNRYADVARIAGKSPEEMFWAPDLYESQAAQHLQDQHNDRRDLAHYRKLVEQGKIPGRQPKKPAQDIDGVVYYLRVGAHIKIGWTSNLATRMRSYSPDSILLATEPGTRKDETRRHRMFAAHRTHGREWYAMVPSLTHHIAQLVREHGEPDPVRFAAQPVEIPQPRRTQPVTPRPWVRRVL